MHKRTLLPAVGVTDKGVMVPATRIEGHEMVLDGPEIGYRPWALRRSTSPTSMPSSPPSFPNGSRTPPTRPSPW